MIQTKNTRTIFFLSALAALLPAQPLQHGVSGVTALLLTQNLRRNPPAQSNSSRPGNAIRKALNSLREKISARKAKKVALQEVEYVAPQEVECVALQEVERVALQEVECLRKKFLVVKNRKIISGSEREKAKKDLDGLSDKGQELVTKYAESLQEVGDKLEELCKEIDEKLDDVLTGKNLGLKGDQGVNRTFSRKTRGFLH